MRIGGRALSQDKENRLSFGIGLSGLVCLLILVQLLLVGLAAGEPEVIEGDTGGRWIYRLYDEDGFELCENVVVGNGCASLMPIVNGTDWDIWGVAVRNRGIGDTICARSPSILKEDGIYKMWYAGFDASQTNRILYATSDDGFNWEKRFEPVMNPGYPGQLDDTHVMAPVVMNDGGTYKMWYTGNDSVNEWAMYATSNDGLTWTKRGNVFDETGVRPNTVMRDEGILKIWYQYMVGGHWMIHYAESIDGIEWTNRERVLETGETDTYDDMHVSGAAVVKDDDGIYRMWYSGHDEETGYRIMYATSIDGKDWVKHGLAIDQGDSGENDQAGASYPFVMKDDDGYYKIWYNGVTNGWDVKIIFAVNAPTFMESGCLRTKAVLLPQNQLWKDLSITKVEQGLNDHIRISVLDGTTGEPIPGFGNLEGSEIDISSINSSANPTIKLFVAFEGDGATTPVLDDLLITWENPNSILVKPPPDSPVDDLVSGSSIVVAGAVGVALFSLGIAGSSEVGKYRLIPFISPLYTRLKREEVLDQLTRDMIYDYIMSHPGHHYNEIKNNLGLKNGTLAYHLKTLERENFIKSKRDGMYKRFFATGTKIPGINGFTLYSIQGRIMEVLIRHPGLSQNEMAKLLDASQQLVSYHLNQMIKQGHIRAERRNNVLRYFEC